MRFELPGKKYPMVLLLLSPKLKQCSFMHINYFKNIYITYIDG
jgi:hypothetical protein